MRAVTESRPDVVLQQMTALSKVESYKHFDREFKTTNELREKTELDIFLRQLRLPGVGRFIAPKLRGLAHRTVGRPNKVGIRFP